MTAVALAEEVRAGRDRCLFNVPVSRAQAVATTGSVEAANILHGVDFVLRQPWPMRVIFLKLSGSSVSFKAKMRPRPRDNAAECSALVGDLMRETKLKDVRGTVSA